LVESGGGQQRVDPAGEGLDGGFTHERAELDLVRARLAGAQLD
jgi:hypothetical protein